jgi:regulator of nucleoside diphosphate kinase
MNTQIASGYSARRVIVVAEDDARRLAFLLGGRGEERDAAHLRELSDELERAVILAPDEIPEGVVTMYSVASVLDLASGACHEISLVYPHDADPANGRISVLAPLGTALLGYRAGDELEWIMPGGLRRLRIQSVRSANERTVRH